MMRESSGGMMRKAVSWADLPRDILTTIMEELFLSERLPLCLVCKSWHEASRHLKQEQFLPWVAMTYGPQNIVFKVWDPSEQASHHIVKEYANRSLNLASAHASRQGWLLFSETLYVDAATTTFYDLYFLYNPFTDEIIKFPKLMGEFRRQVTFTSCPPSPNCMIIDFTVQNRKIHIKTCHLGDKSWKMYEDDHYGCDSVLDVACAGDLVYFAFLDRQLGKQLGVFNRKQQNWKVFRGFLPKNVPAIHRLVVAFNGVLLLRTESSNGRRSQFWRFDLSEEKWVVVEDERMKKQAVFLGHTSFTVPAVRDAAQSGGMVYDFNPYMYYLSSYSFDSDPPLGERLGGKPQDIYQWLHRDHKHFKTWIQPPFLRIWR